MGTEILVPFTEHQLVYMLGGFRRLRCLQLPEIFLRVDGPRSRQTSVSAEEVRAHWAGMKEDVPVQNRIQTLARSLPVLEEIDIEISWRNYYLVSIIRRAIGENNQRESEVVVDFDIWLPL